ncbi:hypothetical protein [Polaribacter sp. 11A2H]|uniref:hypothetical protein n=1 Tax=Polaribacter sp. 11A2H TaxID=2687290 RepID=UPI0014080FCA|nr:hypothetical protein [Polaribacter sp. 11A2H]
MIEEQAQNFFTAFINVILLDVRKLVYNSCANGDYFRIYFTEDGFNQTDWERWYTPILNNFTFKSNFFAFRYFYYSFK